MNTQVDCWKQHPPLLQPRGQPVPALPFVLLFPQKSCLCCGEVSPWLSSARMVLRHKQLLVPGHTLALRLHTARQRWHKTLHWGCKEKPHSHFSWPCIWWAGSPFENEFRTVRCMRQLFLGLILVPTRPSYIAALGKPSGKDTFLAMRVVPKTSTQVTALGPSNLNQDAIDHIFWYKPDSSVTFINTCTALVTALPESFENRDFSH